MSRYCVVKMKRIDDQGKTWFYCNDGTKIHEYSYKSYPMTTTEYLYMIKHIIREKRK
jgi:hypothetical protein